jgi:hypothetical protein
MDVVKGRLFGAASGSRVHTTSSADGRVGRVDPRVGLERYEEEQIYFVLHHPASA